LAERTFSHKPTPPRNKLAKTLASTLSFLIFAEAIAFIFKGLAKTALTPFPSTASYKLSQRFPVDSITTASPSESSLTDPSIP
jgi:hypothetical protein